MPTEPRARFVIKAILDDGAPYVSSVCVRMKARAWTRARARIPERGATEWASWTVQNSHAENLANINHSRSMFQHKSQPDRESDKQNWVKNSIISIYFYMLCKRMHLSANFVRVCLVRSLFFYRWTAHILHMCCITLIMSVCTAKPCSAAIGTLMLAWWLLVVAHI